MSYCLLSFLATCSPENKVYDNAYNYLITEKQEEITQFYREEIGKVIPSVSNEIVYQEIAFFNFKLKELSSWDLFEEVDDVESYLWNYDSKYTFDNFMAEEKLVRNENSLPRLIIYFSKVNENLLVADLVYTSDSNENKYENTAKFGRSKLYLFEVNSFSEIINAVSMDIHHN